MIKDIIFGVLVFGVGLLISALLGFNEFIAIILSVLYLAGIIAVSFRKLFKKLDNIEKRL